MTEAEKQRRLNAYPILAEALALIRRDACENFTTGLGSCYQHGRTPDAKYGAERCCDSCIADAALASVSGKLRDNAQTK
jgi:hypothetical protein